MTQNSLIKKIDHFYPYKFEALARLNLNDNPHYSNTLEREALSHYITLIVKQYKN